MDLLRLLTPSEQVAAYLREQILRGTWGGVMPGAPSLAVELGVDHRMIIAAYGLLEKEGLLAPQGAGRRRRVILSENHSAPALRVRLLLYEDSDREQFCVVDFLHRLLEMGHAAGLASKSLQSLGMDVTRVRRFVENTEADAWVVFAASREILEWFAEQPKPAFAFAGRRRGIPIASVGPDKIPAQREALRRLVALGHRRIVLLVREERRQPGPGSTERAFLGDLKAQGVPTGPYNLPAWKDEMEDFHRCIESLFRHTPPTALLIDGMPLFIAAQQRLARLGILAPRDVSLVCLDPDPAFYWCKPSVAHIHWESKPLVRRMTRWADHVARGRDDRRQSFTKAEFVEGGTIGPVPEFQVEI
jgi:DNA-binding LacI/PurR family transcriptional regulator/DNA-binding transcriptional regulator YhcF (GntR family)